MGGAVWGCRYGRHCCREETEGEGEDRERGQEFREHGCVVCRWLMELRKVVGVCQDRPGRFELDLGVVQRLREIRPSPPSSLY
jgi:hypothetical protein